MHLKITNHAQHRLEERGVSMERVKQTLRNPDRIEDAWEGKKIAKKTFGAKVLEIVFYSSPFKDKEEYIVVTAYYLKKN